MAKQKPLIRNWSFLLTLKPFSKYSLRFRFNIQDVQNDIRSQKVKSDLVIMISTIRVHVRPKKWTEPGVRISTRSLLAYHTLCKCSMDISRSSERFPRGLWFTDSDTCHYSALHEKSYLSIAWVPACNFCCV